MRGLTRRCGGIAVVIILLVVCAGAVTADAAPDYNDSESTSDDGTEFDSEYIQLKNLQTGETYYAERSAGVDAADVPAGQYRVSYYKDSELVQRDVRIGSDGSVVKQDHSSTGIQTVVGRDSFQSSYGPNETVNIWTGVQNASTAIPEPVAGVNLTITINQPDGTIDTFNRTTNANGSAHLAYNLSQRPDGEYYISVSSANYRDDFASFIAGPAERFVPENGRVTVGNTTTVEVLVSQAAEPVAGETRNVTIRRPDGTRSIQQVTTDQDGFAAFSFTPQLAGPYDFSIDGTSNAFGGIYAGAYLGTLKVNGDDCCTDVVQGNNLSISGTLYDGNQLAENQTIKISVINETSSTNRVAQNFTVETDEFGQYLAKWNSSNESGRFTVLLYDSSGQQIAVDDAFVEVVLKEENTGGGGDSPSSGPTLRLDIDAGDFDDTAVPGNTQSVSLRVTEDGNPVPNATVDIGTYYDFSAVPAGGLRTVETNSTGQATFTVGVPTDAPAGAELRFEGVVSFNGSTEVDGDETLIAPYSYRARQQQFNAQAGDTVGINVTAVTSDTGTGVSGVPGALIATSESMGVSVINTSFDRTGTDGWTVYNVTLPSNGRSVRAQIRSVYETGFAFFDPRGYGVSINGVDKREYNTSETVRFDYTTTSSENVSALVSVLAFDTIDERVLFEDRVKPGENVSVTVPGTVPDGTFYQVQVRSVSESGELSTEYESFRVNQNRVAVSGRVENATGAALSEQLVVGASPELSDLRGGVVNSTGDFELSLLPDRNYSLTFVQNGTAVQNSTAELEPPRDGIVDLFKFQPRLSVSSGTDIGTQVIPNGSVVEVKTVNESGAPVSNATVAFAHRNETGESGPVISAFTNKNGFLQFNQTSYTGIELTGNVTIYAQPPNRSTLVNKTYTKDVEVTQDTTVTLTLNETVSAAASLTASSTDGAPGENVTVQFGLTNEAATTKGFVLNVTQIPENVTVVNQFSDGATWSADRTAWTFQGISAGATKQPNVSLTIPENQTASFNLTAIAKSSDGEAARKTVAVTPCETIPKAIDDNDNGKIGDFEILTAIEHWRDSAEVPGTCGKTIGDFKILELIETWRNGGEV